MAFLHTLGNSKHALCGRTKLLLSSGACDQLGGAELAVELLLLGAHPKDRSYIIRTIEQTIGVLHYIIHQGSLKKTDFLEWLKSLVDDC